MFSLKGKGPTMSIETMEILEIFITYSNKSKNNRKLFHPSDTKNLHTLVQQCRKKEEGRTNPLTILYHHHHFEYHLLQVHPV